MEAMQRLTAPLQKDHFFVGAQEFQRGGVQVMDPDIVINNEDERGIVSKR
jgi:hypothetical protein